MPAKNETITRKERDPASCWSIEDLFPDDGAWSAAFEALGDLPEKVTAYRGRLGESAGTLLEYLELSERVELELDPVASYAMLRHDEDTADPDHQAMQGRIRSFLTRLSAAASFERPELGAISDETLERFYREEPGLEKYRRYLTRARLGREHTLSAAEEKLMAGFGQVSRGASEIFTALTNADLKFPAAVDSGGAEHRVTNGSYVSLMASPDRALRRSAFNALYGVYGGLRNGLAAMLNVEVQKNVFTARARGYGTALQAALEPNEIPQSVYHNLLSSVHDNLDKMHRYMALRKRAMGLSELHMYDVYAPMAPEADRAVPFEEAREYVLEAARVYGPEYCRVLESAFTQRWMDIYENAGKRSGAYSSGCRVHPFVLLNYNNDLDSAFTLAHEMGHAMHSWLSAKNQPPVDSGYVLFVAEVASTCNEALLMYHLLDRTRSKTERAVLINYFLEQFRTTLYRQAMFAEFELKIHTLAEAGESLTARTLCDIYLELNRAYYGPEVVLDPGIETEWARIPHFYRRFYVYQYATGFSAAMALSRRIRQGGEEAVRDYLKFLSGGCSTDPVSLLKIAGVDMSTPEPVNAALALFGELIGEMESLLY